MDNNIYDKIADYQDWVHLERPAGGASEMEKLKGGKMKDEIKELKKEALEKLGEQENPEPWFSPQEVLDVIAEIEKLEKLDEDNLSVIAEMGEQNAKLYNENKQLQAEIEQLKQDYKDHTKVLGDKLNDQIEYGKEDREIINELRTVLALYKLPDNILVEGYQKQQEKIEELGRVADRAKRDRETETFMREAQRDELHIVHKKLKQLQAVCDAAEEVLKTITWLCEHEPDNILIPRGLQVMCKYLHQTLVAKDKG